MHSTQSKKAVEIEEDIHVKQAQSDLDDCQQTLCANAVRDAAFGLSGGSGAHVAVHVDRPRLQAVGNPCYARRVPAAYPEIVVCILESGWECLGRLWGSDSDIVSFGSGCIVMDGLL